ncbi:hypothetical protein JHW43_005003 [Diplocarpon mali]|nr:hypothetical protein JHW43_005003 [Diplocarpon mali]
MLSTVPRLGTLFVWMGNAAPSSPTLCHHGPRFAPLRPTERSGIVDLWDISPVMHANQDSLEDWQCSAGETRAALPKQHSVGAFDSWRHPQRRRAPCIIADQDTPIQAQGHSETAVCVPKSPLAKEPIILSTVTRDSADIRKNGDEADDAPRILARNKQVTLRWPAGGHCRGGRLGDVLLLNKESRVTCLLLIIHGPAWGTHFTATATKASCQEARRSPASYGRAACVATWLFYMVDEPDGEHPEVRCVCICEDADLKRPMIYVPRAILMGRFVSGWVSARSCSARPDERSHAGSRRILRRAAEWQLREDLGGVQWSDGTWRLRGVACGPGCSMASDLPDRHVNQSFD